MSSDGDPAYIELYTNANGSFSKVSGRYLKGLEKGNGTVLLMHFNKDFFIGENEVHVYDWSGNGGNGTVLGVSYNDSGGKFFGAFEFNGSDNRIEVPDSTSLDLVCVGSIEFWLKMAGMSGSTRVLMKGNTWGSGGFPYSVFLKTNKRVYMWLETSDVEVISSSALEYNKWYHVAVTWDCSDGFWNASDAKIYINGSLDGSFGGEFAQNMFANNKDLEIGGQTLDYGGSFDFPLNGTIDELVLYDRVLAPDEVSSHYNMSFGNQSGAEWNVSLSEDGTYVWNCLAYDNETSNWSTMNYTFHVDARTPPAVNGTNLSPGSEDEIDPGVNISVTANVTDVSNVSTVILQYKAPLASLYINDTMDYSASKGLWENGTIETTDENGNWSYRIWSNDTNGNSGYSETYILPVEKDKTWSLLIINSSGNYSDSFGSVTGFKGAVQTLGILIINNTGDYTLGFDLVSTPVTVAISYNVTLPFDVSYGDEKHVEVNATMPETPNEYGLTINITSSEAITPYREANATVISCIGGPYINETTEITDYPPSITQSSSANFTASIKNIGNETAFNVWLNWTFPSGWSLTLGNQTNLLGNLTPQASASVTVGAYAGSSASAGAATIRVSSSSNGTAGSDIKTISVSCNPNDGACGAGCVYETDDDCDAPSSGRGTSTYVGIGTVIITEPRLEMSLPERIDLTKGESSNLSIEVTNPVGGTNLTNIAMQITGYPETLITTTPSIISIIFANQSRNFVLEISVPPFIEDKDFLVSVTVSGTGIYGGGTNYLESSGKIIFAVHGVVESEALGVIRNAELALGSMMDSDFASDSVESILEDAKLAYSKLDFDLAQELAQQVVGLEERAFRVFSLFKEIERGIEDAERYGVRVEEAKRMENLARSAFHRGDYERAEDRMTAAITAYQLETKDVLALRKALYDHWFYIVVLVVSSAIALFFAGKRVRIRYLERKLAGIRNGKDALVSLIKRAEDEYFNKKSLSRLDYNLVKGNHQRRLAELEAEEPHLASRIAIMKGGGRREALLRERDNVKGKMKALQNEYFNLGKSSKNVYDERVRALQAELAGIEKELGKIKGEKRFTGFMGLSLLIALTLMLLSISVSEGLENSTAQDATIAISQAEDVLEEMRGIGLGTEYANHTLNEAKHILSEGDYSTALTTARYVSVIKQKALLVDGMIDDVEVKMLDLSEKGFDVSGPSASFEIGAVEFEKENFERAEEMMVMAMNGLDDIETRAILSNAAERGQLESIAETVYENRALITASVILLVLASVIFSLKVRKMRKVRRVGFLEREVGSLKDSIKALQDGYFNKKSLSRKNYDTRMQEYKKGLSDAMSMLETEKRSLR